MRELSRITFLLFAMSFAAGCGEQSSAGDDADTNNEEGSAFCEDRADGSPCGEGSLCIASECVASICGDGYVDASRGEDCDDANAISGDGCENDCRFSCQSDADCQDDNFCNGPERCFEAGAGKLCIPAAMPLNCDEGAACTVYSCDPNAETLDAACTSEEISLDDARCWRDADGDGHPSFDIDPDCDPSDDPACENGIALISNDESSCGCPEGYIPAIEGETAADCDDEDALTYPGAPQICGNAENNDCAARNGSAPPGMGLTYYCARDNDRDGYPDLDRHGNLSIEQGEDCVCPEGLRYINYTNIDKGDCDGTNKDVHPGVTAFTSTPYCPGQGARAREISGSPGTFHCAGTPAVDPSFDFNCDNTEERKTTIPANVSSCTLSPPKKCSPASAWTGPAPACGKTGQMIRCSGSGTCRQTTSQSGPVTCR